MSKETRYIVVHGGPETGKSLNRTALMEHYNCDECIDDLPASLCRFLENDGPDLSIKCFETISQVLILSPVAPLFIKRRPKTPLIAIYIPVEVAAVELGDKWVAPVPFYGRKEVGV